jgi:hypothetical protein
VRRIQLLPLTVSEPLIAVARRPSLIAKARHWLIALARHRWLERGTAIGRTHVRPRVRPDTEAVA